MARVLCEQHAELVILRVFGNLSIDERHAAIKAYFPKVVKDLIWDFTAGSFQGVTVEDMKLFPRLAQLHLSPERICGKTAYVCPTNFEFGMFRKYTAIADIQSMPYEYDVFRDFNEALRWIRGGTPRLL